MTSLKYLGKRLMITIILIFLVASGLFLFFRLMPGSFVDIVVSQGASPEKAAAIKEKWGLNEPIYIQYFRYITNMITGDVGKSFIYGEPVLDLVSERIRNSFILVGPAITAGYLIGSLLGALMGRYKGSKFEQYGVLVLTLFGTVPSFVTGILLIVVFAFWLNIFPSQGMLGIEALTKAGGHQGFFWMITTKSFWMHYTLPFVAITLRYLYTPGLIMRTSVVEVGGQAFMYYHKMKGLQERKQLKHLIKHASLPVITIFPVSMASAVGGLVLVEEVFNWPGIGKLLITSVLNRDFPVVQFVFLLVAIWVIIGNFVVDLTYSIIDPRVSVEDEAR